MSIRTVSFYNNYYGHKIIHIIKLYNHFTNLSHNKSIIYLAGDSTLDNKYWVKCKPCAPAVNGYDTILNDPKMVLDVCYHLSNCISSYSIKDTYVINCAVEESTMGKTSLNSQDIFIQKNIQKNDILVVSIGGNDLAISPSLSTIWNMLKLVWLNSKNTIKYNPKDAWGIQYFVDLFHNSITNYVSKLVAITKPKKVVICSIYFPDMKKVGGWADSTLSKLDYDNDPAMLQSIIKYIHREAISKIYIPYVNIVCCPLYTVLDGTNSIDYVERVEPSFVGGQKIAEMLFNKIFSK